MTVIDVGFLFHCSTIYGPSGSKHPFQLRSCLRAPHNPWNCAYPYTFYYPILVMRHDQGYIVPSPCQGFTFFVEDASVESGVDGSQVSYLWSEQRSSL